MAALKPSAIFTHVCLSTTRVPSAASFSCRKMSHATPTTCRQPSLERSCHESTTLLREWRGAELHLSMTKKAHGHRSSPVYPFRQHRRYWEQADDIPALAHTGGVRGWRQAQWVGEYACDAPARLYQGTRAPYGSGSAGRMRPVPPYTPAWPPSPAAPPPDRGACELRVCVAEKGHIVSTPITTTQACRPEDRGDKQRRSTPLVPPVALPGGAVMCTRQL
jgi:hypothetical protein